VAPLLRKYTLLLRNATLALVESHEEEALARGPRAQPTAPSKRERRHCGFEVKRALTALHDCGNELEAAHSSLDGSADAAQARILKREAQRVKALLALAEERLGSV